MKTKLALIVWLSLVCSLSAHDTWVEVNTPEVRAGNLVHVDLKLGNHGNDHRDFKLHSLISLDHATLKVHLPSGEQVDLKPKLIGTAYEEKQGYWTTRLLTTEEGLHVVAHELDTLHGKIRAIKSAKTYFIAGVDSQSSTDKSLPCDTPLGHPLELIPLTNPVTESGPGMPLRLRVLFENQPLVNARVSFIPRGQILQEGFDEAFERMTDEKGDVQFTPQEANVLLVVIHHREPERSGDGYESTYYSATMTIAVPQVPLHGNPDTTSPHAR